MSQLKSFDQKAQVLGEVIMAFLDGFPPTMKDAGLRILERHEIQSPQPGKLYPLQSLLNAMKEVATLFGANLSFQIDEEIATNVKLPPDIKTLDQCLGAIDVAYHMNHRAGEIGYYKYVFRGPDGIMTRAEMECNNPYPFSFDRGVIEGFAKRFKPSGSVEVLVR